MTRRFALLALSAACATLAACSNPTAPAATVNLDGVYQGSGTKRTSSSTQDDGVYQGSGTRK